MLDKKLHRSPNYPKISLKEAIERARRIYDHAHRGPIDTLTALELMGYRGESGPSLSTLSALKKYGLLEGSGKELKLSNLAVQIVEPMNEEEKAQAISDAAAKPDIFQEVLNTYSGKLPSDEVLRAYLIRAKNFAPSGAAIFLRAFRETADFARSYGRNLSAHDELQRIAEEENGVPSQQSLGSARSLPVDGPMPVNEGVTCRISPVAVANVQFQGQVTQRGIEKLIAFLNLVKDNYPVDNIEKMPEAF